MLGLCEQCIGDSLNSRQKSIIDRCIKDIYEEFLYNDPVPEKMPVLEDFLNRLNDYADQNDAARRIANPLSAIVQKSALEDTD